MNKRFLITLGLTVFIAFLVFAGFVYNKNSQEASGILAEIVDSIPESKTEPVAYACNGDGKICWDGSIVGRTGSDCHFSACPAETATSTMIRTTMGQVMTGLNVSITPREIVSDSRCPSDVQCIWAGTVEVRAAAATKVSHGEHVWKLGEPRVFGDFLITLVEVTPAPKAGEEIADSSYRFVFEVKKK